MRSCSSRSARWPRASCRTATSASRSRAICAGGKLFYAGGVFNGVRRHEQRRPTSIPTTARTWPAASCFNRSGRPRRRRRSALSGLGFNLGGAVGTRSVRCRRSGRRSGRPTYAYAAAASADGDRTRVHGGRFLLLQGARRVRRVPRARRRTWRVTASGTEVSNTGWNVTGSYVLTGEAAADRGRPARRELRSANRQVGRAAARGALLRTRRGRRRLQREPGGRDRQRRREGVHHRRQLVSQPHTSSTTRPSSTRRSKAAARPRTSSSSARSSRSRSHHR